MVVSEKVNKNTSYLKLDKEHVNPVLSRYWPIVAEKASGSFIYDMNGDKYLDLACGIAVTNLGHCHPKIVKAVQDQVAELMHTSVVTHHKRYIELAAKMAEISPGRLDSAFFANSGAEVVEGCVKLARYVTGRPAIINFKGAFHGRTLMAAALTTSKMAYRENYEPLPGPVFTVPYPYVLRSEHKNDPEKVVDDCIKQFDVLFNQFVSPTQIAGIIVEPVQGEGGYVVPPASFLPKLRKIADQHGILLIIDEVQTGFGRTGKMFAIEHFNVEPDIMLCAKGIASGMPLGAIVSRNELTQKWKPARHGSTFGGNPISCAAALATIEVMESEKLPERAAKLGAHMLKELKTQLADCKIVSEVRGIGLMLAIDFSDKDGNASHDICDAVAHKCFENKLLVLTCGTQGQVVRLIPPLTISDAEAEEAIKIIVKAVKEVNSKI